MKANPNLGIPPAGAQTKVMVFHNASHHKRIASAAHAARFDRITIHYSRYERSPEMGQKLGPEATPEHLIVGLRQR